MDNENVKKLKAMLAPFSEISKLTKKTANEYAGPCPVCGGDDRFYVHDDRGFCRNCRPKGGDLIDWHQLIDGVDLAGLMKKYGIGNGNGKPKLAKNYDYHDADGQLIFQVCRMEPKDFRQRRPDGKGGFIWNMQGVDRVPYRLPEVIKADEVLIVEGEKDADNLAALGFTATTNPGGAKKWRDSFNQYLAGKRIVILPDNDGPGREHLAQVAQSLAAAGIEARVVRLPSGVKDVSDFIATFQDREAAAERLAVMIDGAEPYMPGEEPDVEPGRLRVLCATSLLEISSEKIETRPLAAGFIDEEEKIVFHGDGGCKKSLLTQNMAAVFASGQPLLWDRFQVPRPLNFLFVQSENGRKSLNERARKMVQGNPDLAKGFGRIFFAGIDGGVELAGAVSEKSFRDDVYECAKATGVQIDCVSFDPLISYHDADENDNSRMRTTLDWISEIAANIGANPFVIHHDNRMGAIRGASAITDWTRHKIHVFLTRNSRRIQLVSEKRNNAEKFQSFLLEMDDFLNFKYLELEDGLNPKLVKRCQDVKDALILQGGSVETQAQLADQYREKTGLKNDSTIRNHIQEAVSAGFIFCEYYEEDGIKKCKYHI